MSQVFGSEAPSGVPRVGKQIPPLGRAGQTAVQARMELEHARESYMAGRCADAMKTLEHLVEWLFGYARDDAEYAEILGSACTLLGLMHCLRDQPADEWFSRAVQAFVRVPTDRLDRGVGVIVADYGVALQHTGDHQQAVIELDRAIELGQDTADVRRYYAAALRDRGEPGDRERAHALLVSAVERAPMDWQAWEWLAALTEELNRDPAEGAAQWATARQVRYDDGMFKQASLDGHRAVEAYQRAVVLHPADAELLLAAGQAMAVAGQNKEAAGLLRRAAELPTGPQLAIAEYLLDLDDEVTAARLAGDVLTAEPDNERAVVCLARALATRSDEQSLAQAEERLASFLRSHTHSTPAEAHLGEISRLRGKLPSALTYFDQALDDGAEQNDELAAFVHGSKGQALVELGRDQECLAELQTASERDPDLPWVRFSLADAYLATNNPEAASATLRDLIERWPLARDRATWLDAMSKLGSLLVEAGDSAEAVGILRQIPGPEALSPDVLGPLTTALLDIGQESSALAGIHHAEQVVPYDLNVRTLHARALYRVGRFDEAAELLAAVLDHDGERWRDRAWLGEVERMRGRLPAALEQLDQVLAEHPDNVWSLSSRAAVYLRMGTMGSAEEDLRRCLDQDPRDLFSLRVLRDLLIPQGRYRELVATFRQALRALGSEPGAGLWYEYARLLRMLAPYQEAAEVLAEAEQDLAEALQKNPGDLARLLALRDLLVSQGRFDDAVSRIEKALGAPGPEPGAELWREYGETLRQAGRYADARKAIDNALRRDSTTEAPQTWHVLGRLLLDQDKCQEAIAALDHAVRGMSAPAVWYDAFTARILAGRYTEARDQLREWLSEHTADADAWWLLGQLYYRVGAWQQAALAAANAARHDRDDAKKSELLGWALLRAGADLPGTEAAFARAIELEPMQLSPLRGKAHALWLAGMDDTAHGACQELLDKVTGKDRPDADAQAIRGWSLARLDRPLDAIVDYIRILPAAGEDRAAIEFDLAVCQFQAGYTDDAATTLSRAWLDLELTPDPALSQHEPELRRRGIMREILQDLRAALDRVPTARSSDMFTAAQDRLASELQKLPEFDADSFNSVRQYRQRAEAMRHEVIEEAAYFRWINRGKPIGDPWADWFAAEAGLAASRAVRNRIMELFRDEQLQHQVIAETAYRRWLSRGQPIGDSRADWLTAEAEVAKYATKDGMHDLWRSQ